MLVYPLVLSLPDHGRVTGSIFAPFSGWGFMPIINGPSLYSSIWSLLKRLSARPPNAWLTDFRLAHLLASVQ